MAYCDFCECPMCQTGDTYSGDKPFPKGWVGKVIRAVNLEHAQLVDGRWICSTCYDYEVCLKELDREGCEEFTCKHRPELATGEWTFWTYWVMSGPIEARDLQ
jgi:hypothetical protein